MNCTSCDYDWPEQLNRCPFCGSELASEPPAPDSDVIAMDLALAGPKSRAGVKNVCPKPKAPEDLERPLTPTPPSSHTWAPCYASDQIQFAIQGPPPARVSEALAKHRQKLSALGFAYLGDGIVPQRLGPPYVTVFSNPTVPCVSQVTSFRPGLPGGAIRTMYQTRFSDGALLVTTSTPTLRYAVAPWVEFLYLPRHSLKDLFDAHAGVVELARAQHGSPELWDPIEEFAESAIHELGRWFDWALSTGLCARVKVADCKR